MATTVTTKAGNGSSSKLSEMKIVAHSGSNEHRAREQDVGQHRSVALS